MRRYRNYSYPPPPPRTHTHTHTHAHIGSLHDSDSGSCGEESPVTPNTPNTPTVVLDKENGERSHAAFRRAKMKNRVIPIPKTNSGDHRTSRSPRRSVSPRGSPHGSPRASPRASPRTSPRSCPVRRKMGVGLSCNSLCLLSLYSTCVCFLCIYDNSCSVISRDPCNEFQLHFLECA